MRHLHLPVRAAHPDRLAARGLPRDRQRPRAIRGTRVGVHELPVRRVAVHVLARGPPRATTGLVKPLGGSCGISISGTPSSKRFGRGIWPMRGPAPAEWISSALLPLPLRSKPRTRTRFDERWSSPWHWRSTARRLSCRSRAVRAGRDRRGGARTRRDDATSFADGMPCDVGARVGPIAWGNRHVSGRCCARRSGSDGPRGWGSRTRGTQWMSSPRECCQARRSCASSVLRQVFARHCSERPPPRSTVRGLIQVSPPKIAWLALSHGESSDATLRDRERSQSATV